jgi:iron complex transport system substrate-binding protein
MPRVLIVQYLNEGGQVALNVPPAPWIQTTEAELAGGVPVWKDSVQSGGWTVVSFEQIAAWEPDQIFVISYKVDSSDIVGQLAADPQWQALGAMQAGQVYGFAADIFSWDQPDPRWILGTTWLASKMHPELFSDLDMVQEAARFFDQLYGMDQADFQEQIVPVLKGDIE